jgi:hypothetical protein
VEDLGNINITIRDGAGGGGGGGSGGVGGGPNALAQRSMVLANQPIRIAQAVIRIDQAVILQFAEAIKGLTGTVAQAAKEAVKQTRTDMFAAQNAQILRPFFSAQRLGGEIAGYLRRPTYGAALSLMQEGTKTSKVLAGMGTVGHKVMAGMMGLGIVVSGATLAMGGLRMATNHVQSRIEQTWLYSSATVGAMAEQQITKVTLVAREAQKNGEAYARSIRAQTEMIVKQSEFNIELGKSTAMLSRAFYELRGTLYQLGTELVRPRGRPHLFGPAIGFGFTAMEQIDAAQQRTGLSYGQLFQISMKRLFEGDEEAKKLRDQYLREIARNTSKRGDPSVANEWFQADIMAMTGLPY